MKKWLAFLVAAVMLLGALAGCQTTPSGSETSTPTTSGESSGTDGYQADQSLLYGVCYVDYQMNQRVKTSEAASIIGALGAKSVRVWNHSYLFMADYKTVDPDKAAALHSLYSALKLSGVEQLVGMNHYWYLPSDPSTPTIAVPRRDTTEGSDYMKFLEMYEEMWYNIALEFPEITYWEMGNEMNHDPFLIPADQKNEQDLFTLEEKADITTDMMFYSSRGIKRGNPEATTILPGMAPVDGIDGPAMLNYLERIYQNIESGNYGNGSKNTNDYFEALAWHPYSPFACPDQTWVDANNKVHDIAVAHGDGNKKVFLTEVGFPDGDNERTDETHATWVKEMYRLIKEQMPYVESCHYYRLFNDGDESYGLMGEPADGFGAKAKGTAFQEIAGGTGDLNRFSVDYDSYVPGDNVAFLLPVICSTSCEHSGWGWSKAGINDGNFTTQGWSNYYEYGDTEWATNPNGSGAHTQDTVEYVGVEFPKTWKVNKVLLYSRNSVNVANPNSHKIQGVPREMQVEVSNDGETWTKVAEYTVKESDMVVYPDGVETGDPMTLEISFDAVEANYLRVVFTKLDADWGHQEDNYFVQLMEMQIIMAE